MFTQAQVEKQVSIQLEALRAYYANKRSALASKRERIPAYYKTAKQACYFLHQEEKGALVRREEEIRKDFEKLSINYKILEGEISRGAEEWLLEITRDQIDHLEKTLGLK